QLCSVPYRPKTALRVVRELQKVKKLHNRPYEPVGWSKCLDCCFHDFCWEQAFERKDVAMLPDVDQGLARELHDEGINTYVELLARYSEARLANLRRRVGSKPRKVGHAASSILAQAKSFTSGEMTVSGPLNLNRASTLVMFDVEGIPAHLDYAEKTY